MTENQGDDTTENDTTGSVEEAEETVEETVEEVEETFEDAVEETEESAEDISERIEEQTDDVLESVDENVDRLLSEILDTRSRVAVYVGLRKKETATPEEVAEETGLYPDKVERVLEDLEDDEIAERAGIEGDEYEAVSPTELVRRVPESVGGWLSDLITPGSEQEDGEETTEISVE